MASSEKYKLIQKTYRKKFLLLQKEMEKEFSSTSKKLMEKINRVAFDYAGSDGLFLKSQMDQIKMETEAISYWFSNEMKDWLDNNIVSSTDIAIKGQDTATEYYIRSLIQEAAGKEKAILRRAISGGDGILLRAKFGEGLTRQLRSIAWKTRWKDGFTLSERVWKLNHIVNGNLHNMIEACVNEGMSAVNFSRAVEQYLEIPGPIWTAKVKSIITDGGSVKYNAFRLARTETNNAYREAQNLSAKESDIVKGIKWNLSGSHPEYDICDDWATQDLYGLGAGVYPPGSLPPGHPNCLCYLTDVLYEGEELVNTLKQKYAA